MAAFVPEVFEELHRQVVAPLASGGTDADFQVSSLKELLAHKDHLSKPFAFRQREDSLGLPALAQHVLSHHSQLAREPLVVAIDNLSRQLRLHQHDCCVLVDKALALTNNAEEIPQISAAMYRRECHFLALILHDLAQRLPDQLSVAFFAAMGGRQFIKSLFEAFGLLLKDLSGDRGAPDRLHLSHTAAMIRLLVETLMAYFFTIDPTADEVEQIIALLPHVVVPAHAPLGGGFMLSDLDLVLHEEHHDIDMKLCLLLVYMCHPEPSNREARVDITRVPQDIKDPTSMLLSGYRPQDSGGSVLASPLGQKMKADYWNEDTQLGQFLSFAISGVFHDDQRPLRNGFLEWHSFHFILNEILLSSLMVGQTCSGRTVAACTHDLLSWAVGDVSRRWQWIRKLEVRESKYHNVAADSIQVSILRTLNRLCRIRPSACEGFRELALHCTDTFHMQMQSMIHGGHWASGQMVPSGVRVPHDADRAAVGIWEPSATISTQSGSSSLYAEILDFVATICARGSPESARIVSQKLAAHSNQWFNWSFLMDKFSQLARNQAALGLPQDHVAPTAAALCHLVSATCGSRLLLSATPPQSHLSLLQRALPLTAPLPLIVSQSLVELLASPHEAVVKAAALGALANMDLGPDVARGVFASISAALPNLIAGVCDMRSNGAALAVELLSCSLRLVQAVPIHQGRYAMDLHPFTSFVVNYVLHRASADPASGCGLPRYWRLASLALRWLRLILRGPLPPGESLALAAALVAPYSDGPATAVEVARLNANGNATAYAFRCLLTFDSPIWSRFLYLTTLHGGGSDALSGANGTVRPYMLQVARTGLDIVRLLFQRDTLFCRLHTQFVLSQASSQPGSGPAVDTDAASLQPVHKILFAEFPFLYPPKSMDATSNFNVSNPFCPIRSYVGDGADATMGDEAENSTAARQNPSYLVLLLQYVGFRSSLELSKLAIYLLEQCSRRDPRSVLRSLRLVPRALQRLSGDLAEKIIVGDSEDISSYITPSHWDSSCEAMFQFETAEVDLSAESTPHLDVSSLETSTPVCKAVDEAWQRDDDAKVAAGDIAVWPQSIRFPGTEGEDAHFAGAYLRGDEVPPNWLVELPTTQLLHKEADGHWRPLMMAVLPRSSCRLLVLRFLAAFLGGEAPGLPQLEASMGKELACVLLGLDPDHRNGRGEIDLDTRCAGQESPLDAVMTLLENPPVVRQSSPAWQPPRRPGGAEDGAGLKALGPPVHSNFDEKAVANAERHHAAYEAALAVMLGLLSESSLQDVALRYICHSFPSRFEIVRARLSLPWDSLPPRLCRVLLSEVALLLQIAAAEMQLVAPYGLGPQGQDHGHLAVSIADRQRLEMKRKVAEHLQDAAHSFLESQSSTNAAIDPPLLLRVFQVFADAFEPFCNQTQQISPGTTLADLPQCLQESLEASVCICFAVGSNGKLQRNLPLRDPNLFWNLAGLRTTMGTVAPLVSDNEAVFALRRLMQDNTSQCYSHFAESAYRALGLFFRGCLQHLVTSSRLRSGLRAGLADQQCIQAVRAHLEALLPLLGPAALERVQPRRVELLAYLVSELLGTLQPARNEGTLPLAAAKEIFRVLREAAVHPRSPPEARRHLSQALLLLLERVLPDPRTTGAGSSKPPPLASEDVQGLGALIAALLEDTTGTASVSEVTLPLLIALLSRVPQAQFAEVLQGRRPWLQFKVLLDQALPSPLRPNVADARRDSGCRFRIFASIACAIATVCQVPKLATLFFESGCLAKILRPEWLEGSTLHLSLPSVPVLDVPHPMILHAVLQLLAALAGRASMNHWVLHSIMGWALRHQKTLLELLTWVTRLPLTTSTEPSPPTDGWSLSGSLTADLAASESLSASTVVVQGLNVPVLCTTADCTDATLDLVTSALCSSSGDLSAEALQGCTHQSLLEERARIIALAYRSAGLAVDLWASLCAASGRSVPSGQLSIPSPMSAWSSQNFRYSLLDDSLERLRLPLEALLLAMLTQMSSLAVQRDVTMRDTSTGGERTLGNGTAALGTSSATATGTGSKSSNNSNLQGASSEDVGLHPSESTRWHLVAQVLRAIRHDRITLQLQALIGRAQTVASARLQPWQWGIANANPLAPASLNGPGAAPQGVSPALQNSFLPGGMAVGVAPQGVPTGQYYPASLARNPSTSFMGYPVDSTMGYPSASPMGVDVPVSLSHSLLDVPREEELVQLAAHARTRANALCVAFLHACSELLGLRYWNTQPRAGVPDLDPQRDPMTAEFVDTSQGLAFDAPITCFQQLTHIVETSLHLLDVHLRALAQVAPSPSAQALGVPRLTVVLQHLRRLRNVLGAVGGPLLPVALVPSGRDTAVRSTQADCAGSKTLVQGKAWDSSFITTLGDRVEKLLLTLQSP